MEPNQQNQNQEQQRNNLDSGDLLKPDNSTNPGTVSSQPQQFKPKRSKRSRNLLIVLLVLLLVLAGLLGWLWWRDQSDGASPDETPAVSEQTPADETPETINCAEELTAYSNEDLNLQFCYPADWGVVAVSDAKFDPADTGERWRLSFSDKPAVNLGLVTEDWSTAVARDGVCVDPATQVLPAFSPFSTDWQISVGSTEDPDAASRGLEVMADQYLITEHVDNLLTNGVCMQGYGITGDDVYPFATASYFAEFTAAISTPSQHMASSTVLIPATERSQFAAFVQSIQTIE